MKKNITRLLIILTAGLLFSCNDLDDQPQYNSLDPYNFVWKGLNQYYYYQENVANLSDHRFNSQEELNSYLSSFTKPETLFENLIYNRKNIDKFSFITSNYTVLEQILSGTNDSNGMEYGISPKNGSQTEVFGWVKYIMPNSDASTKDLKRGDLFYGVNGIPLTRSNYRELLSKTNYTLNLASYDGGAITPNGKTVALVKKAYSENPVYITDVIEEGNKKIGYLMYNGFYTYYEPELNQAFGKLKAAGITDLVLDLRYNSGGSVATATRLASMITGQFEDQIFAKEQWNSKISRTIDPNRLLNKFTSQLKDGTPINSLNLNKVYILTTANTASASELVINCLKPYIQVVQIGDTTTGKNVGSITLYDSPNYTKRNLNPTHRYAMQLIVLKIVNKVGFGDYEAGITPDATNILTEDISNLGVLGNRSEPYLAKAMSLIKSGDRIGIQKPPFKVYNKVIDLSKDDLKYEMYVD
ncbi:peptidase S41 [Flavobacterium columnare]|uniref:S41 family peptidase n=1 Tax=Flavobacterium columnare TaxID=996 RepID=UPI0017831109|nr:S41 family peptidase [Flavobacterium columnare]QOG88850.1 peptidase S41 [Flavobacterium columnare]QOG91509.1 peptidase S41 [Flavobacterium columnare]QOG94172.1 peptidase S41 [Flavobacterium columnare]QOG96831.1 peptidase S41 [Flavobacterium columnare]QOG99489.1 peptidase S41 [Flavobacterium columnare]